MYIYCSQSHTSVPFLPKFTIKPRKPQHNRNASPKHKTILSFRTNYRPEFPHHRNKQTPIYLSSRHLRGTTSSRTHKEDRLETPTSTFRGRLSPPDPCRIRRAGLHVGDATGAPRVKGAPPNCFLCTLLSPSWAGPRWSVRRGFVVRGGRTKEKERRWAKDERRKEMR